MRFSRYYVRYKVFQRLLEIRRLKKADRRVAKRKNPRKREWRDPEKSAWAYLLREDGVADPTTLPGKQFRRRFRVPYPFFRDLLKEVEQVPSLKEKKNGAGKAGSPTYLKLLSALRVLGRGEVFDTCSELSYIHEETLRRWFHAFTAWYASQYHVHIRAPKTPEEIRAASKQYTLLGFPGAVGSVDVCHTEWERCPAKDATRHTGRYMKPTTHLPRSTLTYVWTVI
jgi:hypothetical protein